MFFQSEYLNLFFEKISSEEAIGVCEELVSIGIVKNIKEGKKNKGAAFSTEKIYSIPVCP